MSAKPSASGDKLDAIQSEIDRTKGIMKANIDKTLDRGTRLEAIEDKADQLNSRARMFQSNARQVRRNMCLQYWKTIAVIVVILIVILAIIIGVFAN